MNKQNAKKALQLGEPHGTASNRLRKTILFSLLQESGKAVCFQCGCAIDSVDTLSIEHKTPWLDSDKPRELFFDLNNVSFSHMRCNIAAARKTNQKRFTPEEKRAWNAERKRRQYTPEKRREKYRRELQKQAA